MKANVATNFDELGLILTISDMASIYRISEATIRRGLQAGTFTPRPFGKYPYRWRKAAIEADLRRDPDSLPHRAHGFAAVGRVRPAKAAIDATPKRRAR